MITRIVLFILMLLGVVGVVQAGGEKPTVSYQDKITTPGIYAQINTNKGAIVCELFPGAAPLTVKNFIMLAEGQQPYYDPEKGEATTGNFYDGLIFHRVIPEFMIQGGDPTGTGRGGPGYQFKDEINPALNFDRPGRLAMANSGPNTNGSQFFITVKETPWLNGRHTIFGQVVFGQKVVEAISEVERNAQDRPKQDILIENIDFFQIKADEE
jgi:peptidyl-prolyl cis-trans isomerase A (cyclophilin A)